MSTVLEDLVTYLATNGHGTISGAAPTIRGNWMPPTPDAVIALWEYPGSPPQRTQGNTRAWFNPRVQMLVRDLDPLTCSTRAKAAAVELDSISHAIIGDGFYLAVEMQQSPGFLQYDENQRTIYVCNFAILRAG